MASIKDRLPSTIHTLEAKKFDFFYDKLEGISEGQLIQHYQLYEKYINKVNEINGKLNEVNLYEASQTHSDLRSLVIDLSFAMNATVLHEMYFSNLTDKETQISEELMTVIERDFDSWDYYINNFKAVGMSMRGWVFTGFNYRDGKLYNFGVDEHSLNLPVGVKPILVMDVWEHAYMVDYGINRKDYIEAFMQNINWDVVSYRFDSALKSNH